MTPTDHYLESVVQLFEEWRPLLDKRAPHSLTIKLNIFPDRPNLIYFTPEFRKTV